MTGSTRTDAPSRLPVIGGPPPRQLFERAGRAPTPFGRVVVRIAGVRGAASPLGDVIRPAPAEFAPGGRVVPASAVPADAVVVTATTGT